MARPSVTQQDRQALIVRWRQLGVPSDVIDRHVAHLADLAGIAVPIIVRGQDPPRPKSRRPSRKRVIKHASRKPATHNDPHFRAEAEQLLRAGLQQAQVAAKLACHVGRIQRIAAKASLGRQSRAPQLIPLVLERLRAGHMQHVIANDLGISQPYVAHIKKHHLRSRLS